MNHTAQKKAMSTNPIPIMLSGLENSTRCDHVKTAYRYNSYTDIYVINDC
jgi:hypothetical protein